MDWYARSAPFDPRLRTSELLGSVSQGTPRKSKRHSSRRVAMLEEGSSMIPAICLVCTQNLQRRQNYILFRDTTNERIAIGLAKAFSTGVSSRHNCVNRGPPE